MRHQIEAALNSACRKAQHPLFIPLVANVFFLATVAACLYSVTDRLAVLAASPTRDQHGVKPIDDTFPALSVPEETPEIVLRSLAEAKEMITALPRKDAEGNASPDYPKSLSATLAELDQWSVGHDDIDAYQAYKLAVAEDLRSEIEAAVKRLHASSIQGSDSAVTQSSYGEAGQLIALFPISDDAAVLKRASELSTVHSLTGARIEAIRRQRYNLWALGKIGSLLGWLEKKASSWTTKDNPQVVNRASDELREIDPGLLEPAAMQLYTLAITKTSEAISTSQQSDLAKRLTDPSTTTRRNLGDF